MTEHVYFERTVRQQTVFEGKIIRLEQLTVELPNGRTATREVVRHPGAVAVLAEIRPGSIVLVDQFRKAPGLGLLEIPAGKLEPGEDPLVCARRELAEETGLVAVELQCVCAFYTSPGFADERITVYYTGTVEPGQTHPDEDEFLHTIVMTQDEVAHGLEAGKFLDAKTIIALQWWLARAKTSG